MSANGDVYAGHWVDGYQHGYGVKIIKASGVKFTGEWKEDEPITGTCIFPDGSKYVGGYQGMAPHGFGRFLMSDGSIYEGRYEKGNAVGNFLKINTDNSKVEGVFSGDVFIGKKFWFNHGASYEGQLENN